MTRSYFDKEAVVEVLRNDVARAGSQSAWANAHGYNRTALNKVLSGHREISRKVIRLLELETAYVGEAGQEPCDVLHEGDVLRLLQEDVDQAGGQSKWARLNKHERTHLSHVLSKRMPLTLSLIHI